MRIAIDASRTTVARATGTERYALELLRAIIAQNSEHELLLYFRDTPPPDLLPVSPRVEMHICPFARAWTHIRFAAELWRTRPDLTFVPAHTLPALFPGRAQVTVHDLGYRYFPAAHTRSQYTYLDLTTRYSAARADLVLADSRATADDLTRFYGTPTDKIRVVYPGVRIPPLEQASEPGAVAAARARLGLPERYWLYVGTLQPRKNIVGIVRGYRRWQALHPDDPAALVLAGARGWRFDPAWTQGVGVIETGYIAEADKWPLYAGALGLIFPSLYEGFGFPVIEAFACGTPVICSRSASLPELGGSAAYYVDLPPAQPGAPHSVAQAAEAAADQLPHWMDRALAEHDRDDLRTQRQQQAARFSWAQAATAVLDSWRILAHN